MERKFYHSDFEDLIKEKADQYKMYPSDKVWKNINHSLRSRKKWYWTGFVILLSGVSYISITEIMKPAPARAFVSIEAPAGNKNIVAPKELVPFSSRIGKEITSETPVPYGAALPLPGADDTILSKITVEDSGLITASFDIPLQLIDNSSASDPHPAIGSLLIEGLEPLAKNEVYNIEVSLPSSDGPFLLPGMSFINPAGKMIAPPEQEKINWLEDQAGLKLSAGHSGRISWQLAFSPTINYRKLVGGDNAYIGSSNSNIPLALHIKGDVNSLVHHTPALGFELGTHGFLSLSKRLTLKGGIQFNYSKYDIRAYHTPTELATISLNSSAGRNLNSLTSYTDIRNFGGSSVDDLKNQYFQFSLPVGLELKVFGNDRLQFDIAGTLQPTYLLNKNSYLITTDYKNYTKAPTLVRRWNMDAGAEAYLSYSHGDIKWQVGPQFRYQLFSSYDKAYPIKEYLMEYGIKIGVTKTIR